MGTVGCTPVHLYGYGNERFSVAQALANSAGLIQWVAMGRTIVGALSVTLNQISLFCTNKCQMRVRGRIRRKGTNRIFIVRPLLKIERFFELLFKFSLMIHIRNRKGVS